MSRINYGFQFNPTVKIKIIPVKVAIPVKIVKIGIPVKNSLYLLEQILLKDSYDIADFFVGRMILFELEISNFRYSKQNMQLRS